MQRPAYVAAASIVVACPRLIERVRCEKAYGADRGAVSVIALDAVEIALDEPLAADQTARHRLLQPSNAGGLEVDISVGRHARKPRRAQAVT